MTVITIWTTYMLVALATSAAFIVAGRRSKHVVGLAPIREEYGLPVDPLWIEAELDLAEDRPQCDPGAALRLALKRLVPAMTDQRIHADVAASPGLMVRMRGAVLTDLLEEMLVATIHAAPASRLLLTTSLRGERISVSVTDDVPRADPHLRRAAIEALTQRVVMRGGTLDIDVHPDEGTTTTLRLTAAREDSKDQTPLEPAPRATSLATPRAASNLIPVSYGQSASAS
jgi:hypothetical protein